MTTAGATITQTPTDRSSSWQEISSMDPVPAGLPIRVLIVDDDEAVRWIVRRQLEPYPQVEVVGEAATAEDALTFVEQMLADVVVMDVTMPVLDGIEATRRITKAFPGVRVVQMSVHTDPETITKAVDAGASGYIVKGEDPDGIVRAVVGASSGDAFLSSRVTKTMLGEAVEAYRAERARADGYMYMMRSAAEALTTAMEARDSATNGHSARVAELGLALLRKLDPAQADDPITEFAYLLHDVGKISVPDSILLKPGPLTDDEWRQMQQHPVWGEEIVGRIPGLRSSQATQIVRHHHERWDGAGYPDGLSGEQIPLACRVFAVVDTFDAITSDRPYRRAATTEEALEEIRRHSGTQFDPAAVDAFVELMRETDSRPLDAPAA